jgi:hypothetical protein
MSDEYHAPVNGDLFAPIALCGTTPEAEPDGVLRLWHPGVQVTCAECRRRLLEGEN